LAILGSRVISWVPLATRIGSGMGCSSFFKRMAE
jgi:hypothetical protein